MDTTYVMGFWRIPANKKHNMTHYYRFMPKTFEMLAEKQIVFFYEDDDILDYIKSIVKTPHFLAIRVPVVDLPTYPLTEAYLQSCKNQDNAALRSMKDQKGLIHHAREYLQSGEDSYRKVIGIWTSKILLVERIIAENPYSSSHFAWIDISVSRFNTDYIQKKFDDTTITTPSNCMLYKGELILNNASFMISGKDTWLTFFPVYKAKLEALQDSNYAHDEETILHLIRKDHPDCLTNIL